MRYNVTISGIVDGYGLSAEVLRDSIGNFIRINAPRMYQGLSVTDVTEVREVTLTVPAEDADLVRRVLRLRLTAEEIAVLDEALRQHRYGADDDAEALAAEDEAMDDDTDDLDLDYPVGYPGVPSA